MMLVVVHLIARDFSALHSHSSLPGTFPMPFALAVRVFSFLGKFYLFPSSSWVGLFTSKVSI